MDQIDPVITKFRRHFLLCIGVTIFLGAGAVSEMFRWDWKPVVMGFVFGASAILTDQARVGYKQLKKHV